MKTFKEFVKKKLPVLSWLGHPEFRKPVTIKEAWYKHTPTYDKDIHDHPDYAPQGLTADHKNALGYYSGIPSEHKKFGHSSSHNINGYLRNRLGATDEHAQIKHHKESDVHNAVKRLSSAFTPENTNKKPITLHSGVPQHIGMALAASEKGSQHHLAGFTSTSTKKEIANDFANAYAEKDHHQRSIHMIEYDAQPGTALSVARESNFPEENEMLLHHGAKITYNGTTTLENGVGIRTHVHHVTVHNEHKPLEEYGPYNAPKQ